MTTATMTLKLNAQGVTIIMAITRVIPARIDINCILITPKYSIYDIAFQLIFTGEDILRGFLHKGQFLIVFKFNKIHFEQNT